MTHGAIRAVRYIRVWVNGIDMALFTDTVFNERTQRHELHFVNQQYDMIMAIYFDEKTNKYIFSTDHSNAIAIVADSWNRKFDPEQYLREAEKELKEADKNKLKGK